MKVKQKVNSQDSIKVFLKDFSANEDFYICPIEEEDEILNLAYSMYLSSADTNVIIYISGYVAEKVSCWLKCQLCRQVLLFDKELMVADFSAETEYLQNLDRGGLKYPSDISIEIGVRALKVFRAVTSETFELRFLNCTSHKSFLYSLITEYTEPLINDLPADFPCKHSPARIIEKSVGHWTNIFLNNYTKELNNTTHLSNVGASTHFSSDLTKRRKLNTFSNQSTHQDEDILM